MISRYFIDKRVFVTGKDNRFLNLAGSYDLNDIVSQIVAGTLPGQPILPYTFSNGITLLGSDAQLGGILNRDTGISGSNLYDFEIVDMDSALISGQDVSLSATNNVSITTTNGDVLISGNDEVFITSIGETVITSLTDDLRLSSGESVEMYGTLGIYGQAPNINFMGDFSSVYLDHWKIENATVTIPTFGFSNVLANGNYFSDAVRSACQLIVNDGLNRKMSYIRISDSVNKYDHSIVTDHGGTRIVSLDTGSNDECRIDVLKTSTYIKGGQWTNFSTIRLTNLGIKFDSDANDGYTFPKIDGVSGQTLISDGNGQLSWGSVATALTAQNGLNLVGTTVELGGPLTSDVTIDSTTFDLTIDVDDLDLRGNTVNMNSATDFDVTVVDDLSISTDRLLLTTSTTAITGDVLSITDGALGVVEPVRNRQTITFDVVAWNTTLVGAGQAQAFVMIPSYMNNWIIEEILLGVGQSASDPCDFSLEFSGGGSPYLVPITVAPSTTFTASAVTVPVVTGDYVRVQNIVPGGSAPKGLTVTLTLRNN